MAKRSSIPSSLSEVVTPQLVFHYISAHKKILNFRPYVHPKHNALFTIFEQELRELYIPTRDFAYTIVKLQKAKVLEMGWKAVPIRMFLSDYSLERYQKIQKTTTVDTDYHDDEDVLLHSELLVARLFIDKNVHGDKFVRIREVVEELKPLLSSEWLEAYENKKGRPEIDAIDILLEEFGISGKRADSYLDIVSSLR